MNAAHAGFTVARYTSVGPIGVGTTAHFKGKQGGSEAEWDMAITEFEKNRKLTWHTMTPSKITMILTLEPITMGTKLTHTMDYEVPYSYLGKLIDKFRVSKDIDKELTIWLENAKKMLEFSTSNIAYNVNV